MEIISIQKFFYEDDILVKKELYKETPFENPTNISYFSYDSQGQMKEEKICLRTGEISYYFEYTAIEKNRYRKKMINPDRSNYRWVLTDIDNTTYYISVYETMLTGELLREALDFVINNYSKITQILVSVNYAEDKTKLKEIIEIENYYREKYNFLVSRMP
ncbi:MAG: hypothetical protein K0S01_2111 [Herbinix sp.]|jgi:hypothetical protein|nr:hypothetical protein [Herbinix sp.]